MVKIMETKVDSSELKLKVKAERAKYYKEWRLRNKDKVKKHNEKYWEKRALKNNEDNVK